MRWPCVHQWAMGTFRVKQDVKKSYLLRHNSADLYPALQNFLEMLFYSLKHVLYDKVHSEEFLPSLKEYFVDVSCISTRYSARRIGGQGGPKKVFSLPGPAYLASPKKSCLISHHQQIPSSAESRLLLHLHGLG